jgi:hypothetical protein
MRGIHLPHSALATKSAEMIINLAQASPCGLKARVTLAQGEALESSPTAESVG